MQLPLPLFPEPAVFDAVALLVQQTPREFDDLMVHRGDCPEVLGFEAIGAGASRAVFDLRNGFVLKVQKYEYDSWNNQTEQEWLLWNSASDWQKNLLCPIIEHDVVNHTWTVMPKVDILDKAVEPIEAEEKLYEFGEQWQKMICRWGMRDLSSLNVGVYEGRTVAIDYGIEEKKGY
jgi:hypothetical protein